MKGFLGISGEFSSKIVFEPTFTTRDLYIDKIVNILSTRKRERPMRPEFGCILWDFLFENITEEELPDIEDSLKNDLNKQLQPIYIEYIKLVLDDNKIDVTLSFRSPEDSENTSLNITLI